VKNLTAAMPPTLKHVAMCTSAGVERADAFPFFIINLFGVLTYKKAGEECVKASGIPYTIIRPGRLSEGPFTGKGVACNGWDEDCTTWQICWSTARACAGLNDRVLRATTGTLKGVNISNHDDLSGQAARSMVAELLAQAFLIDELKNRVVAMESTSEEGPGTDTDKWRALIPVP
jgi:hypothetical protein